MSVTSNPKVSIAILAATLAATVAGRTDLIAGSIGGFASAVSDQLYPDVAKLTETELDTLFGANTDVRARIKQFIASNGGYSRLDVKVVDEAGTAVVAVGTVTVVGTAAEDGILTFSAVDAFKYTVDIAIVAGDDPTAIAAKVATAYNAAAFPDFPMAVASTLGAITFTSVDKGTIGNFYKIRFSGIVPSVTVTMTSQPVSGANNPVLTTFFDNIASTRYTGINWPSAWITDIAIVKTYLDDRFNATNAILDGVAFNGLSGTFAGVKVTVDNHNSQSIVFGGNFEDPNSVNQGVYLKPLDWDMAYFQGIRARRLTTDAPIASFITTTSGVLDAFGGLSLASLPYFNSPFKETAIVDPNLLYTQQEQTELEAAGFSVFGTNVAGNGMITGPMVTTRTTDTGGNPNDSFLYLNYVDTSSICREYFFNNLKSRFSQSRLTNGSLVPNRSIENEESIKSEFVKLYKDLSNLALTIAGAEAEKFFLANLVVTIDLANRKVTATFQLPIVTQLGEIIATAQLNFNFQEV